MKKQILIEELNKIHKVMGLNPIIVEAAFPGLGRIITFVENIISDAARVGRALSGDQREIATAFNLLKTASNIDGQLTALARLSRASKELSDEILPMIRNVVKQINGGEDVLKYMDEFVATNTGTLGNAQTERAIHDYIDQVFRSQPQGLKNLLKDEYTAKINSRVAQSLSSGYLNSKNIFNTLSRTEAPFTIDDILNKLRQHFSTNPQALAKINDNESLIRSYVPRTKEEGLKIVEDQKDQILKALDADKLSQSEKNKVINNIKDDIKKNPAYKIGKTFYIGIALLGIMEVVNEKLGITGITPLCQLFRILGIRVDHCASIGLEKEDQFIPISPEDVNKSKENYGGGN